MEADFSGGHLSSDGGVLLLLRETDRQLGLCDKLAHRLKGLGDVKALYDFNDMAYETIASRY